MSNFALIVDTNRRPLDPIHPAQARLLLQQKKAAIFRSFPFTLILKTERLTKARQVQTIEQSPRVLDVQDR